MSDYDIAPYSQDSMPDAISPEGAKIANAYLMNACSLQGTSKQLNVPSHVLYETLQDPMIKSYVSTILKETGYRHMVAITNKLDDLIERKWAELEEAEIGSNKDIADLLALAHKMQSDMHKLLADGSKSGPSSQTNIQVNDYGSGNYGKLMEKIINS